MKTALSEGDSVARPLSPIVKISIVNALWIPGPVREVRVESAVEGGTHQVAELVVGDSGGVFGSQPDGPRARLELRVTGGEAAVPALVPAVDRYRVIPHADEESAVADLVGRHLVRE